MLAEERLVRITEILNQRHTGIVSVAELVTMFGVSGMTIRRDLQRLEEMSLLRRVHGGAVAYRNTPDWAPFVERHGTHGREKQTIGWAASLLVKNGDTVLLDAGTTTPHIAHNLTSQRDVTVVTHALPVAQELLQHPRITIVLLGGVVKQGESYSHGPMMIQDLSQTTVDKLFLSAAGFSVERGATDPDPVETALKQAMSKAAREIILVADSSKWRHDYRNRILPIQAIQKLVVDDGLPGEAFAALESAGVEVITPSRVTTKSVYQEFLT
ncbi:MAG: DeoR/GlpR family DNA-binding transcription regulator [Anaerolineae bacterium]|nr:DeoR/GlpR family DNA-binding transcription regulator [Anaerolineae bacterium]